MERILWDSSGKDEPESYSILCTGIRSTRTGATAPKYPPPQGWTAPGTRESSQVRPGAGEDFCAGID